MCIRDSLRILVTAATSATIGNSDNGPYKAVFNASYSRQTNNNWFYLQKSDIIWVNKRIVDVTVMSVLNSVRSKYQADADTLEFAIHTANCIPAQLLFELLSKKVNARQNLDNSLTTIPVVYDGKRTYFSGLFNGVFNLTYHARKEFQPQPTTFTENQASLGYVAEALPTLTFNPEDFFLKFNLS